MFGKVISIVCVALTAAEVAVTMTLANKVKKTIDGKLEEITEIEAETEE